LFSREFVLIALRHLLATRLGEAQVDSRRASEVALQVYNLEFVLLSILRQELASKDPACAPAGST
jgi:hypothetical protein